jgi:transcriptional regulator with XRE-family HTH domain
MEKNERLKIAREKRGFRSAAEAARRLGVPYGTYSGHESGTRGIKDEEVIRYAQAFRVPLPWLAYGIGSLENAKVVPIVGVVGPGEEAHLFNDHRNEFEEVSAPDDSTSNTVAVEIKGDSVGPWFDRWVAFYDNDENPPSRDLVGHLCVVGTQDGSVLLKKIERGSSNGVYTLLGQFGRPLFDKSLRWAAPIKAMRPR